MPIVWNPQGLSTPVQGLLYLNFVLHVNTRKYGVTYAYFKETLLILKLKLTSAV